MKIHSRKEKIKMKTKGPITVTIDSDLKEKLIKEAENQNRSVSNMVEKILVEYLKENQQAA